MLVAPCVLSFLGLGGLTQFVSLWVATECRSHAWRECGLAGPRPSMLQA
jgi:hypothetical protein